MLLVGLTGGIGSGKSTVARLLEARDAVVLDADVFARQAVEPGSPGLEAVRRAFGPGVIAPDGSLDRAALAERVFGDDEARRALERIVHPEVMRRFLAEVEPHRGTDRVVVYVVPLLVERSLQDMFDLVVTVSAPEARRVAWAAADRGVSPESIRARADVQVSDAERAAVADVVVPNDGSLEDLARWVDELWDRLTARSPAGRGGPPSEPA